jgi:hypothetical protein
MDPQDWNSVVRLHERREPLVGQDVDNVTIESAPTHDTALCRVDHLSI